MNPARIQALAAPPTAAPPIAAPPIVALAGLLACADGFVYLHGSPLALPPKEQAALHLLISEWPKVVSKERFAQQVWPGQDMSDESLARCMAQLRKPLSRCTRLRIQSVYQRGYRLVVPQEAALPALPTLVPGAVHARLLHDALAQPAHVAVLTHARQLVQQRTPASLQHAEQLLTELIAQAPGYLAAPLALAECLACQISSGLALDCTPALRGLALLDQVRQAAPDTPGLDAETAHLLDCCWRFDEAALWHRQALRHAPDDSATHYYLGWHLLATGRPQDAAQALGAALRLNPFSVSVTLLLARTLTWLDDGQQTLVLARRLHDTMPDNLHVQVYRLACEAFVQPQPELIEKARALLSSQPSWVYAGSSLAYTLARCGATQDAIRLVTAAKEHPPGRRINYLGTLLELRQQKLARQWLQDALQVGCGQLPLVWHLRENMLAHEHPEFQTFHPLLPGCSVDALDDERSQE